MKLGMHIGYWGAAPPLWAPGAIAEAERLGFDSIWTAESWGSDALTPLAWWGSASTRLRLGTNLAQLSARTPTATAMAALTMDHLSNGRFVLGLGVSGPQVVEGWYGQPFPKPLARTREYVSIIRQVLAREDRVTSPGPHYPLPHPGGLGLGKPLKPITHPLRADVPINFCPCMRKEWACPNWPTTQPRCARRFRACSLPTNYARREGKRHGDK